MQIDNFDKCIYCRKSYIVDPDTGRKTQERLYRVHTDLWACDICVEKYNLTSEGDNFSVPEYSWDV